MGADSLGIAVAMLLTSPKVWSPSTKRLLSAFVVLAIGTAGPFTWIADLVAR